MERRAQGEIISLRLTGGLRRTRRGTWEVSYWLLGGPCWLLPAIDLAVAHLDSGRLRRRCRSPQARHDLGTSAQSGAVSRCPMQVRMQQGAQPFPVSLQDRLMRRPRHLVHGARMAALRGPAGSAGTSNCAAPRRAVRAHRSGWGYRNGDTAGPIADRRTRVGHVVDHRLWTARHASGLP
jgi:hypothetical protein